MSNDVVERDRVEGQEEDGSSAEAEALKAEVEELRSYKATVEAKQAASHRWRRWLVALLIVLACVIAAGANVAVWLKGVALNTNAWVAAVGPLSRDPAVGLAIADFVVQELFASVDAGQMVSEALPPEATFLTAPIVGAVKNFARDLTVEVINSDQFNQIWIAANQFAHQQLVSLLRDQSGLFYISQGDVTVDFSPLLDAVRDRLGPTALALFENVSLPEDSGKLVVYEAARVAELQRAVTILDRLGWLLPLLSLVAFAVALWVSLWRRRTLLYSGIGLAIAMLLSLLIFRLVRQGVLNQIVNGLYRAAAEAIWSIVLSGLFTQTIFLLVVGLIIAVGAWLAGPHPRAVAARSAVGGFLGNSPEEAQAEPGAAAPDAATEGQA
jgi:hypothetical protein